MTMTTTITAMVKAARMKPNQIRPLLRATRRPLPGGRRGWQFVIAPAVRQTGAHCAAL